MNLDNLLMTSQSLVKTLIILLVYSVLKPKKLGGLCEALLDFRVQTKKNKGIRHASLEEFMSVEYGCSGDVSAQLSLPTILGTRGVTLSEAFSLAIFLKLTNASRCFEIGTYKGWSSHYIASVMSDKGIVYTLDLSPGQIPELEVKRRDEYGLKQHEIGYTYKQCPVHNKQVVQLLGDSVCFDYSQYEGEMDLIFIDGAHSAQYIRRDTSGAFKMAHEGSLIVWHDFKNSCLEVVNYLAELGRTFELRLWHIENTSFVVHKVTNINRR